MKRCLFGPLSISGERPRGGRNTLPTTQIQRNIEGEKQPELLAQRCRGTLSSDVIKRTANRVCGTPHLDGRAAAVARPQVTDGSQSQPSLVDP